MGDDGVEDVFHPEGGVFLLRLAQDVQIEALAVLGECAGLQISEDDVGCFRWTLWCVTGQASPNRTHGRRTRRGSQIRH